MDRALAPHRALLPAMLIVAVMGIVTWAGMLAANDSLPLEFLLAPVAIGFCLLTLSRPGVGVALLPVVGAVIPLSIGTNTQSPVVAALLFAGFLLAVWLIRAGVARDLPLASSPLNAPTVALMAIWVVAFFYSNITRDPLVFTWDTFQYAQLGGLSIVLISAGVLLLSINVARDQHWIELSTWSFLGVGFAAVAAFYLGALSSVPFLQIGGLFTMWVVALATGQALFNDRLPVWGRLGLAGLAAAWLIKAIVFQSWWFSGWTPSVVAVASILFLRSKRAFIGVAAIAAVLMTLNFDTVYNVVWGQTVSKGDLSRLDIWAQSWEMFMRQPLFGTGPAGYAVYWMSLYRESGFSMSTHSNYWDVLLETGLVGMLIFAWLLVTLLVVGWRARTRWRSGFQAGFANGAFGGLLALLLAMSQGDWFTPFVYNQTIAGFRASVHSWVFLGFMASLALAQHPRGQTEETECS